MTIKIPNWLMRDEAKVEPKEDEGSYGPIYGDKFTLKGHFEKGFRKVVDRDGREVVASATFITDGPIAKPEDKVTVLGEVYNVIDSQSVRPFGEHHHYEIMLQSIAIEDDDEENGNDDPYA